MTENPPLILVDGSSYLYRAFHALPPLTNSKGLPTGAVKGVINMMRRLQKDYPNSTTAVVFDAKGKTFRDEIYSEYKANRPSMPDDLRCQIEPIHNIIRAMGMPLICVEGVEADDVIGTYAVQATEQQQPVIISTGDKDIAQLVNQHISLVNTMTDTFMDREGVIEKFGIPPELIIDYLALLGDKSDNIPGVPGVGEKTALGLLQGLGGLKSIYQRLDEVAELSFRGAKTLASKLEEHKDLAFLSYTLATIKTDVAVDLGVNELANQAPDKAELLKLFQEMEFKTWINEFSDSATSENSANDAQKPLADTKMEIEPPASVEYETILDAQRFELWLKKLQSSALFAVDTETTSLDYMAADLVGISFAVESGSAAYIPFGHDYLGAPEQLSKEAVLSVLKPILEDAQIKKVGQNLKYDMSVLAEHGIQLQGVAFDTLLESYVLNSVATRHDMDSLAKYYLDKQTISFTDIAGKGAAQLTFNQIALEEAGPYAAEDADITLRLHQALWPQIAEKLPLKTLFQEIELPLVKVLSRIERNGALVDDTLLFQQSQELAERLAELETQAWDLAGQQFNLASPKQLADILFEKLEIPVLKKTAKGAPSTKEEVLQELALDYPLPKVLLEHRSLAKLKSTYTDKLPMMIIPPLKDSYPYHQAGTATGRLHPQIQIYRIFPFELQRGVGLGRHLLHPGHRLIAADYSQIELRIMAHLSGDQNLLKAFDQGQDVHSATAAEVFGVDLAQVTTIKGVALKRLILDLFMACPPLV